MRTLSLGLLSALAAAGCTGSPGAAGAPTTAPVDETSRVALTGNTPPAASPLHDMGALADDFPLDHMQLVLQRSPQQEAEVVAFVDAQHDPASPLFHQWLSAQEFGERFGVSTADIATISGWLTSHGFRVESVGESRMFLVFSGTAGQVREAFHTELHRLSAHGELHFGNMSDPSIPSALAEHVAGVLALHDFMPHPLHHDLGGARRDGRTGGWSLDRPISSFTVSPDAGGTFFAVAPADFATIYNLNPLFSSGYTGAGQTVVVVEDTLIQNPSDVSTFRSAFGLTGGSFTQTSPTGSTPCTNPGVNGAEQEAALDAEWAGASAPGAAVILAGCADTATVFGGLAAIQNLINGASPPHVISMSYGLCESMSGTTANQAFITTFQQAASEGVSVFVSSGDEGAASCDPDSNPSGPFAASHGIAVSGWASTPYNVAVGGTDFMDTYDNIFGGPAFSTYWNGSNTGTFGSALSYVPEIPWNDGCTSALIYDAGGFTQAYGAAGYCNSDGGLQLVDTVAASGGPSTVSSQPSWQTGVVGLPTQSGGPRYLPDVSLFAANGVWGHFYVYCMTDPAQGGGPCDYSNGDDAVALAAGGTSFASPALAGIQAVMNQFLGAAQGNPNTEYYKLAAAEYGLTGNAACNSSGGSAVSPVLPDAGCVFRDVTQGDIDLPCTGSTNCFGSSKTGGKTVYGALSTSTSSFGSAYPAGMGWDFATGLGTVNATNLATAWSGKVCNIGGAFYDAGSVETGNSCSVCVPSTSTTSWTGIANGTSCNDNNLCTSNDSCQNGICTGTATVCTAQDQCHVAGTCNPGTGVCSNPNATDGTACTTQGVSGTCQQGVCTTSSGQDSGHPDSGSGSPDGGSTRPDGGSSSCSSGCVDTRGNCQAGTTASYCGANGAACVGCAIGQECSNNACVPVSKSGCGCNEGIDPGSAALLLTVLAGAFRRKARRAA